MSLPSPGDLGNYQQRLAQNNARVAAAINSLPGIFSEMIAAADRRDWIEVTRHSDSLAEWGRASNCEALATPAKELAATAESRSSDFEIKRQLLRLIGAAGQARRTRFLQEST